VALNYSWRLWCIGFASFFLVYVITTLVVTLYAPRAVRTANWLPPRSAASRLLRLRLLPFALALFVVFALCVPSYLWCEPEYSDERASFSCIFLAILGAMVCGTGIARGISGTFRSLRFAQRCRRFGFEIRLSGKTPPVWVIPSIRPFIAMIGILRPRIVLSEGILKTLTQEELSVVIGHEDAHRVSCDNLKRLGMLLAPAIAPLSNGSSALERSWIQFAEYTADEAATAGDAGRSLTLASVLVRVAQLGIVSPHIPVATLLLNDAVDLSLRVNRLLAPAPPSVYPHRASWRRFGSLAVFACLVLLLLRPPTFQFVQSILERLIR
jgi:hypothetical protein